MMKQSLAMIKKGVLSAMLLSCVICTATWVRAEEAPAYSKLGKGPVKVFVMAGQSNMLGHGLASHIKMAATDKETRKEFAPLMDGNDFVVRKDVWIYSDGRHGGLSAGYGSDQEKVGPEIGFGWHMGELLREQVLLIKTSWGGHSLKEMFLPPSMGGPGPSYTQMVKEVRDVLGDIKSRFPGYNEKMGYEIVGLVWHQAWNDMIDGDQRSEDPPYKKYSLRQGALLRDLRKDLKAPGMLMVIGEAGFDGQSPSNEVAAFRKAQEATTLTEEFKKTMRFVKTAQFWDNDPRFFIENQGYHYNCNGKTYYFKGKAMAYAMYDLLPKISFKDLANQLDDQSRPGYQAIKAKKYVAALAALATYKQYLSEQKGQIADELLDKKEAIYDALNIQLSGEISSPVADLAYLKRIKDYYSISLVLPGMNTLFKGVPAYDEEVGDLEMKLKTKEIVAEIMIGKEFHRHIADFKKDESKSKFIRTEKHAKKYEDTLTRTIIKKAPDSPYAKAATKAVEELKVLDKPIQDAQGYLSSVSR